METFKRLLLPISSEFFSDNVAKRASKIANIFGSEIYVVYIMEEKAFRKMEEVAEPFLTEKQRKEMEGSVIGRSKEIAKIIFERISKYIPEFENEVVVGEFSDIIFEKIEKHDPTCIVVGFEKECLLKYRFLENVRIPVWIEIGEGENILGVCSNLAPNVRVPNFTIEFAKIFGKKAYLLYVIDKKEMVEVDEQGFKKPSNMEKLKQRAEEFVEKYRSFADVTVKIGDIEEEVMKYTKEIDADVAIVGREMKKRSIFCKEYKKEMAEKIKHSLLFLN